MCLWVSKAYLFFSIAGWKIVIGVSVWVTISPVQLLAWSQFLIRQISVNGTGVFSLFFCCCFAFLMFVCGGLMSFVRCLSLLCFLWQASPHATLRGPSTLRPRRSCSTWSRPCKEVTLSGLSSERLVLVGGYVTSTLCGRWWRRYRRIPDLHYKR